MTSKSWTNKEIPIEFPNCSDLNSIISELESQSWKNGEVVCEIKVNGLFLSESDELKFADIKSNEVNLLEIKTNDPKTLALESIESLREYLPRLIDGSLKIAASMRKGDFKASQVTFVSVLDGCHWVSESLSALKIPVQAMSNGLEFKEKWARNEVALSSVAKELVSAFESKDFVLVSDVLEYDLTTCMENWLELFKSQDKMGHGAGKTRKSDK